MPSAHLVRRFEAPFAGLYACSPWPNIRSRVLCISSNASVPPSISRVAGPLSICEPHRSDCKYRATHALLSQPRDFQVCAIALDARPERACSIPVGAHQPVAAILLCLLPASDDDAQGDDRQ